LAALGRLRVDWARAFLALVIGDRKQRQALLRRARREGWAGQGLRFEVQRLYPLKQRGRPAYAAPEVQGGGENTPRSGLAILTCAGAKMPSGPGAPRSAGLSSVRRK
jgi:hypothetical protein